MMDTLFERKLALPMEVKEMYPLTGTMGEVVDDTITELKNIFSGKSDKIVMVIGPCSADNEDSVIDYIDRLRPIQEDIKEKILIIPRIYTNKPRTTGEGYKGILHQPDPTKKPDLFKGIIATRELHMRAVKETGFACADEMLYPENHKYLDDLLAYVAVGARSVENQQHRLVASGLGIPCGMKNPTSGDNSVMLNAITAAQSGHSFIYRGWEVQTEGNPFAHAILRGYTNKHGENNPNYHYEELIHLCDRYDESGLKNAGIIVDTNHSNSNKNPFEQPRIIKEVLHSCRHSEIINNHVKGFMVESYIEDGRQGVDDGVYGKSITDPCLGIDKTKKMLYEVADLL